MSSSWSVNEKVNDDTGIFLQDRPNIAIDSAGNAYAIWRDLRNGTYDGHRDLDVYFSYRPAGGNWSVNQRVNDDTGIEVQDWPAIVVDSAGNAYAVWKDYRNGDPDIYFSYRPAGGNWSVNRRADDGGTTNVDYPDIAIDSAGNLYALWQDWRNGDPDVYFSYRPADGSWGTNERVSDAVTGTIQYPGAIAVDGAGNAYALWQDNRNGNYDVFFSYRPAGGSWGTNVQVNDDAGTADQYTVAIAAKGNTVVVMWQDWRNGNSDIYSSHRLTTGNWSVNERVNDDTGVTSQYYPAIALDALGNAYAAWSDERNGNPDIYFSYRRGPFTIFLPIVLKNP